MAIGTPTERKTATLAGNINNPYVITPATTIAAGSVAILFLTAGANKQITSVTDAVGNPWTVDHVGGDGTRELSVASCQVATQITPATNITINFNNGTTTTTDLWIQEVTGLATSSVFDTFQDGSGSGTTPASGSTAALAQADEIVFGLFRTSASTPAWTKGAGYTDVTTKLVGASALEYKIVAATTPVSADGTYNNSGSWIAGVLAYKGFSAVVAAQSQIGMLAAAGGGIF